MKTIKLLYFFLFIFSTASGYCQSKELLEKDFDIEGVISYSTSLGQIMAKINFSFEQFGEKKRSDDRNFITVRYKNSSFNNSSCYVFFTR